MQHFEAAAGGSLAIDEGGRGFTPHVTVAKTSRLIGERQKGTRVVLTLRNAAIALLSTGLLWVSCWLLSRPLLYFKWSM
jgi:hypothetical protein